MYTRALGVELPSHPDRLAHVMLSWLICFYFGMNTLLSLIASAALAMFPDLDIHHEHRALFHNLFVCVSVPILASALLGLPLYPMLVGSLSHLALDCVNPSGVALFYPLTRKRFGLRTPIKSGWPSLLLVSGLWGLYLAMNPVPSVVV